MNDIMDKNQLVDYLCQLNSEEQTEFCNQPEEIFQIISNQLKFTYEGVTKTLPDIFSTYFSHEVPSEWKCIALSLYILSMLNKLLDDSKGEILSVKQTKSIKSCLKNLVNNGICSKILPHLPFYLKTNINYESNDIFLNYNILKCTILGLCKLLKNPHLRMFILSENLKEILVGIYQISYCPLKQPSTDSGDNLMTQEIYLMLQREKNIFLDLLANLSSSIHPGIYVRDTMVIMQSKSPLWFKKAVSQNLTNCIRSKNGVEHICGALLGGSNNDNAQTWKSLEVISKLILSCRKFPDFRENICKQLTDLLDKVTDDTLVYERIYSHCTKSMYHVDEQLTKEVFLRPVVGYLTFFTYKSHKFQDKEDLVVKIKQISRLIQAIFVENTVELSKLPIEILTPVLMVLFRFYVLTSSDRFFKSVNADLKSILLLYLETFADSIFTVFDSFLFSLGSDKILNIRNDLLLNVENTKIVINYTDHVTNCSVTENSECLLELLKTKTDLLVKLFSYLLNCLINKENYFKRANEDLLNFEDELMNEYIERYLIVYKLLSDLAEDKSIKKYLSTNPDDIIKYIETVLKISVDNSTHTSDTDSSAFQNLFTILMILQNLMSNYSETFLNKSTILTNLLKTIHTGTTHKETKNIAKEILDILSKRGTCSQVNEETKTDLDKALDDICDPLLPIRGHGLMTLAKLVEKKDKSVIDRKQYVLNIFQQNLKNEDSYIYLSAIAGLAALADVFPDTVLNILCEEYSDSSRKSTDDSNEVRMKLGETLVRVTKLLGEMAPKYKPLLLNTFLIGSKDEDDLIRASSLSNLGEICRVLGYKLGTIVTEVLVCVHAVITTDKSPQARRAAVTVLRQLFVGLEKEMIAFLKDDILPVYRTLKEIYNSDNDEIMRLQAQLALEELNENVKQFAFPNPQLHTEKKVFMLD